MNYPDFVFDTLGRPLLEGRVLSTEQAASYGLFPDVAAALRGGITPSDYANFGGAASTAARFGFFAPPGATSAAVGDAWLAQSPNAKAIFDANAAANPAAYAVGAVPAPDAGGSLLPVVGIAAVGLGLLWAATRNR